MAELMSVREIVESMPKAIVIYECVECLATCTTLGKGPPKICRNCHAPRAAFRDIEESPTHNPRMKAYE